MPDQPVAEQCPLGLWDEFHEIGLDPDGILGGRESQPLGQAADVGVDHDAGIDSERIPENHVCGLASDSWQFRQGFDRRWHFASMRGLYRSTGGLDVLGLVLVESNSANRVRERLRICVGVVGRGLEALEQFLGDLVHLLVGALGGEDCGDQKLQWIREDKFAVGVGVGCFEQLGNLVASFGSVGL